VSADMGEPYPTERQLSYGTTKLTLCQIMDREQQFCESH
jgi:hypothetical protein